MDPNATLADARQLRAMMQDPKITSARRDAHAVRLTELFQALDEWLSSGGLRPDAWACEDTLAEAVGSELAEVLRPSEPRVRPNGLLERVAQLEDQVAQIQRELDAHPNWRQS